MEPNADRRRRESRGIIVYLPIADRWLGGGPVRRPSDFGRKHGGSRASHGVPGMGDYSGPFLFRIRHGKSDISRSRTDWLWCIDFQMVHKKKGEGHRPHISCGRPRRYRNSPGGFLGYIALEYWGRVDFVRCFGARYFRVAVCVIDRR